MQLEDLLLLGMSETMNMLVPSHGACFVLEELI